MARTKKKARDRDGVYWRADLGTYATSWIEEQPDGTRKRRSKVLHTKSIKAAKEMRRW